MEDHDRTDPFLASMTSTPDGRTPPSPSAGTVLVIGVGNDLRGDDGAGRAVVDQVTRAGVPGLRAVWSPQLVPELAEQLDGARLVIFVDAAHPGPADAPAVSSRAPRITGPAPAARATGPAEAANTAETTGTAVRRIEPGPPAIGGHHADPAALLGLAALAGYRVPPAYLVTIPAHDLGLGAALTPTARAAVEAAVAAVLDLAARDRRG